MKFQVSHIHLEHIHEHGMSANPFIQKKSSEPLKTQLKYLKIWVIFKASVIVVPLFMWDTFQNLQWMPETMYSMEPYEYIENISLFD
jgi:hypothetical protein